jgi:preprotein translocase subunit YajC
MMTAPGLTPALLALQFSMGNGSLTPFLVQLVAIFGIFYFLLIRPQQAQKRKHEEALRNIKRGDQIVTFGGIIGEVVHVKETPAEEGAKSRSRSMEDQITIRSAESRLIIERGRIARVVSSSAVTKE